MSLSYLSSPLSFFPSITNFVEVRAPFSLNANALLQAISSAAFNGW